MDYLSKRLSEFQELQYLAFYYDESEISPNTTSFPCIQFQPLEWNRGQGCDYERGFEVRIMTNTEDTREAIIELYTFHDIVKKCIDEIKDDSFFELELNGGSAIGVLYYLKKDSDSYKAQAKAFGSVVAIRYLLRY